MRPKGVSWEFTNSPHPVLLKAPSDPLLERLEKTVTQVWCIRSCLCPLTAWCLRWGYLSHSGENTSFPGALAKPKPCWILCRGAKSFLPAVCVEIQSNTTWTSVSHKDPPKTSPVICLQPFLDKIPFRLLFILLATFLLPSSSQTPTLLYPSTDPNHCQWAASTTHHKKHWNMWIIWVLGQSKLKRAQTFTRCVQFTCLSHQLSHSVFTVILWGSDIIPLL